MIWSIQYTDDQHCSSLYNTSYSIIWESSFVATHCIWMSDGFYDSCGFIVLLSTRISTCLSQWVCTYFYNAHKVFNSVGSKICFHWCLLHRFQRIMVFTVNNDDKHIKFEKMKSVRQGCWLGFCVITAWSPTTQK